VGFGPQVETLQVPHDSLEATEAEIERVGAEHVAAIFVEPVIGAGGVYPPMPGYMEGLAALCERTGILLVADAVICGFGRLGTWFAVERWGIEPAMVDRIAEPFWGDPGGPVFRHGPTYAAHATCCAAALANIKLLASDGLLERGRDLEQDLLGALKPLEANPSVAEVRGGVGLVAAVELSSEVLERQPDALARVVAAARNAGVLIRPLGRAVAVSPPLTITTEHIDEIAQAVDAGIAALTASDVSR
jgi:adenosylmethionine-8-amino-7-oxononanoate aminotransferase